MKHNIWVLIKIVITILLCMGIVTFMYIHEGKSINKKELIIESDTIDTVPKFYNKIAKDGIIEALEYHNILYPEIVYAQAILETGHFKSIGCVKHNNLFGLYNSRTNQYHKFNHWEESVIAYKNWIQYRYKPPEDYYDFLQRINYATDPTYISKVKQIVNKNGKRRNTERDSITQW